MDALAELKAATTDLQTKVEVNGQKTDAALAALATAIANGGASVADLQEITGRLTASSAALDATAAKVDAALAPPEVVVNPGELDPAQPA